MSRIIKNHNHKIEIKSLAETKRLVDRTIQALLQEKEKLLKSTIKDKLSREPNKADLKGLTILPMVSGGEIIFFNNVKILEFFRTSVDIRTAGLGIEVTATVNYERK